MKNGVQLGKAGVQGNEVNQDDPQKRVDKLAEQLQIDDGNQAPPDYYKNKAERIIQLMEKNKELEYEEALEIVEEEERGDRPEGGITPGESPRRREGY